ncbi:hypothetical protein ACWEVD_27000 [Nocardia thailandica]|uniref:Uncharacterized protein n=1 Tax=Nocardia thailandica TaxID=257275 RepID=A0ABW6PST8_9NOCA|nr:hypothetical protein [Nocardia thailandica]
MKLSMRRACVAVIGAAAVALLAPVPGTALAEGLPLVPFQAEQVAPEQQVLRDIKDYTCRWQGRHVVCRPRGGSS